MKIKLALTLTTIAAAGALVLLGQQGITADQVNAGRAAYQESCAGCHQPDLAGRGEAPQLAGTDFMRNWGARTGRDLATYMQAAMPPGKMGSLGQAAYENIAAAQAQSLVGHGILPHGKQGTIWAPAAQ